MRYPHLTRRPIEPEPSDVAALQALNLQDILATAMKGEDWDFADVRQILRAIRVARPEAAVGVISSRLPELLPLVKDVVLVLLSAKHEDVKVEGLKPRFLAAFDAPASKNLPIVRSWLLEAFVRGVFSLSNDDLKVLLSQHTPLDKRQRHLLRGRLGQKTHFRKLKPGFDQLGSDEKYAFLMGASCLPEGELGPFVKDVAKSPDDPLLKVFCGWLLSHKDKVLN